MMDGEKTYKDWIASRTDIEPVQDLTKKVMNKIHKQKFKTSKTEQPGAFLTLSFQILENRIVKYLLAIALVISGLFRVAYVPSLIFIP